jgi:hypothetical protein
MEKKAGDRIIAASRPESSYLDLSIQGAAQAFMNAPSDYLQNDSMI